MRRFLFALLAILALAVPAAAVEPMVATGYRHNLYLADDGTVWAWGWNGYGQLGDNSTTDRSTPVKVQGLTDCIAVAAGYWHSVALKADGTVWVWGRNNYNQLASASAATQSNVPVQVPSADLANVKVIATAGFNVLALRTDGKILSWGYNSNGECGTGVSGGNIAVPTLVSGTNNYRAIAGGGQHSLAIADDGTVWSWGWDNNGQLGNDGSLVSSNIPVQVATVTNAISIAAGYYHSLAVTAAGQTYGWGDNEYGQIGDSTEVDRATPVTVAIDFGVSVSAGYYHSVLFRSNGYMRLWGSNSQGQILRDPGTYPKQSAPYSPSLKVRSRTVGCTGDTVVVIQDDGSLLSWGRNGYGELGIGSTSPAYSFASNSVIESWPLSAAVAVANGQNHGAALRADGSAWSWGYGSYGQTGDGQWTTRTTPVRSGSLTGLVQLSSGGDYGDHNLARQFDGDLYVWGSNQYGQGSSSSSEVAFLSLSSGGSGYTSAPTVSIAGGTATATATVSGGAVTGLTLTSRGSGYATTPTVTFSGGGGSGASATVTLAKSTPTLATAAGSGGSRDCAAGERHSLSVSGQGKVYAWGYNSSGQLGNGTYTSSFAPVQAGTISNAVAVAAGNAFSMALAADGTVWTWGANSYGQLGLGDNTTRTTPTQVPGLSDVIAIAAGSYHALALQSDGQVYAWGRNNSGQLGRDTTTDSNVPLQVRSGKISSFYIGLSGVRAIGAGDSHSLAIANGSVRAWGANGSGQLGLGDATNRLMATLISGSTGAIAVDGGWSVSHGLGADGVVMGMGSNGNGKIGDGSGSNQSTPVETLGNWLPEVSIVASDASAAENPADNATFTISRRATDCLVASLPVNYAIGGTAANGSDYTALTGQAVIPPGSTSVTVTVAPINDATFEAPETVQLTIAASVPNYTIKTGNDSASATIDSDERPTVTSVTTPSSFTAGPGQVVTVTVNFNRAVSVTGSPRIQLETGATDRFATYTGGSGTSSLSFSYTVVSGDSSNDLEYLSTSALGLNGGTIKDSATTYDAILTLPALYTANSLGGGGKTVVVDGIAPTVTSVTSSTDNGTYFKGQSVSLQVVFNEVVTVTGTPVLTLETGSSDAAVNYASGSGTTTLTFTYTIGDGHESADLAYVGTSSLTVSGAAIRDAGLNNATLTLPAVGAAGSLNANKALVIDGSQPQVTTVTASPVSGTYGENAQIDVTVTFNEAVHVTGVPRLTLETGSTDASVNYFSGTGTTSLVFRYIVAQGHQAADLDYLSTTALQFGSGTITDRASGVGNTAILTLPAPGAAGSLGANAALVIEAVRPTVTAVSATTANGSHGVGANIDVTVTFSEPVAVTGTPQITLETGSSDMVASYLSGSGGATLTFRGTVAAGQASNDLEYTAITALALNGGTIKDLVPNSPNVATLTLPTLNTAASLGGSKAIVIDGVAPTVAQVSSATADGWYNAGDILNLTVRFSEAVTVTGTPQLTLETGGADAVVSYSAGSGTDTLTFAYTVAAGHTSADLDCVGTTALALNGGTIHDLVTNSPNGATLTVPVGGSAGALALARNLVIDTTAPGISSGVVAAANAYVTVNLNEAAYTSSDGSGALTVSDFVLTFVKGAGTATGATVTSVTNGAGGALVGGETAVRLYLSVSGTPNGVETVELKPSSAAQIYDHAGNAMAGTATTGALALKDLRGPQVTAVSATNGNGWYNQGDQIDVTVTFDEAVTVGGTPRLTLETGGTDAVVDYLSGSGGTVLTFRYTVAAGHTSADLDYVSTGALALNGGSLADALGNAATLTLPAPGAAGSLGANKGIGIDTTAPTITGGAVGGANAYIDVSFAEGVFTGSGGSGGVVAADLQLAFLQNGGTATAVTVSGVTKTTGEETTGGESILRVTLSITGTPNGLETIEILPASGSAIYDRAGNALGAAQTTGARHLIDATAPYILSVSAAADAFLTVGDALPLTVTFDQAVTVTPTPQLTLETGATDAAVGYTSGSDSVSLTFTYTVAAGEESADLDYASSDALGLNGGTILKFGGATPAVLTLPTPGLPGSLGANRDIVVDTTAPSIASAALAADNSYVDVTFSEGVYTTAKDDLAVGSYGGLTAGDFTFLDGGTGVVAAIASVTRTDGSVATGGESTLRLHLTAGATTPTGNQSLQIQVNGANAIFDRCGNAVPVPAATAWLPLNDQRQPTITAVNSPNADATYGVGAAIEVRVVCDEDVTVTGSPTLTLETGATDAVAVFIGMSGTTALRFSFTVAVPQETADLDAVSLSLNGGSITDAAGNALDLGTLPTGATSGALALGHNLAIDTVAPTVTAVSSATANGSYGVSAVIPITVTFSEAVTVAGGTPRLGLETGASDALVNYASGSGTSVLTFTYTVAAGHGTADLQYLSTGALDAVGATIRDAAGNNAVLSLPALGSVDSLGGGKSLAIDTIAPTVTGVTSTLADGTYGPGVGIDVRITFSEAVAVTGTPTITLETGTTDLVATYASGGGSTTLVFACTTALGNTTSDLDYVSTAALALAGGTIRDVLTGSANNAVLTLPAPGAVGSLGANKAIAIDTTAPTVVTVASPAASTSYGAGSVIELQVTFSEPVSVSGTPTLTLETGASDAVVDYASGSGSSVLSFTYTVAAGHASADLDCVSANALAGVITDLAGNNASLTLAAPGAAGSLGANAALVIDAVVPTVSGVSSGVANGTYGIGASIPVTITFSKAVAVTGTPTLTLETGAADALVTYTSGSGTNTLTFSYTVASGHLSSDLDYVDVDALAGGSITDTVAVNPNAAVLTLAVPGAAGSLGANKALVIDGELPAVQSVTATAANGSYTTGAAIPVTITFNEAVNVVGTPQLTLNTGAVINYGSGSGTTVLTFTYTVAAGQNSTDLDYAATGSLALNGGTIKDAAGNSAVLTLPAPGAAGSLGDNKALVIDTTAPAVTGVTSSTANGSFTTGAAIAVQVQFSEAVTITGTPQLTLETGAADAVVNYSSGSGTSTLTFTYIVAAGHGSTDLDCAGTGALALNGGTIRDATGNNAALSLPTPGAAGSLGANKALVIDTVVPTVTGVSSSLADGSYAAGQVVPVVITFSEAVTVAGGTPTVTLETGATDAVVGYSSGSGTTALAFTYTVAAGQNSADLDCTGSAALALAGATIRDAAGNSAVLTLPAPGTAGSLGASKALVIDTTAPAIASGALAATNAFIDVAFSEGVFTTAGGGALATTDFSLVFAANGGTASAASITGITAVGGGALAGGESSVRLALTITGTPNGQETIEVKPASGTAIFDAVGNAASSTTTTGAKPLNDQSAAYVTGVGSTSVNGTYTAGQAIAITVTFNEAVTVAGTPTLVLETGSNDTQAVYASGSGTNSLTFTYTVAVNDVSADLDYQSAGALQLNGGTIRDGSSTNANLTLPTPGQAGSLGAAKSLVVDAKAPAVLALGSATADGIYSTGAAITVTVTFSEAVTVSGTPQLRLETGTIDAVVDYSGGSGSGTLEFLYVVGANQNSADLDVTGTNALVLNGGSIVDAAGNAAVLAVPAPGGAGSLGAAKALVIDTAGPAVTNVTSTKANGTWVAGQTIAIQVQFGEAVLVTGTPQLTLETGTVDAVVDYSGGSGSTVLTFTYTVADTHSSPDLDCQSASALALNGGALNDAAGNAAALALPVPGAAGSLSANKNLVIATPTITVAASDSSANEGGDTGTFALTLSQTVSTDTTVSLAAAGTATAGVDYDALPASAVIPANSLAVSLVVTPLNDAVAEGGESVELALAAGTGYRLGGQTTAVVTINDDDSPGVSVSPVTGLMVSEAAGAGNNAFFTVRLDSQPVEDVTVGFSSSNLAEGVVSPVEVVFTSGNWNDAQTITVTGVDDLVDDGSVAFTIITAPAVSIDPQYAGRAVADVGVICLDDDEAGIVVTPTAGLVTSEAGAQATFTVVLSSRPTAGVSIGLASSDAGEGVVSPATLTFTPDGWNLPQTVTVVGSDDGESDGNVLYTVVTSAATSDDPVYSGRPVDDVTVTNADDDSAGVTVAPTSGLVTTTAGGQATFTVVLNARPAADVTIALATSDASMGSVSPASLVFTAANWDRVRVATVTGQATAGEYAITTTCTSTDANFNALAVDDVAVENVASAAAILVAPVGGLSTTEYGDVAIFSVYLASAPTSDVVIPLRVSDTGEGDLGAVTSLTFTAINYAVPQFVTVAGLDDAIEDGNQAYAVILDPATSADAAYDAYDAPDVQAVNADNDQRGVAITLSAGAELDEAAPASTRTYDVVLDSQPTGTVVIAVSAGDQMTLSSTAFTFEPGNWSTAQQLVVTVVDDDIDEGDLHLGELQFSAIGGGYSQVAIDTVSVPIQDDDAAAISVTPIAGLVTSESGGQAAFSVALGSQPTANVIVLFTSSDLGEGSVPATITFTPGLWELPQMVTVTGVDDSTDDGDVAYSITTSAVSADGAYNAIDPDDVGVVNQDDTDEAGFLITPTSGLNVAESAASEDRSRPFSISLRTRPVADVTVSLTSSDTAVATVAPATVTFTPTNWATPQEVTVSGVDDDINDGDQDFTILTAVVAGGDVAYNVLDPVDVTGRCRDDDTAGITVAAVVGETSEAGGTATFTVVLSSQPTADVVVPLASGSPGEVEIDGAQSLTFTATDWSTPQTVTLRGVDDLIDDGDRTVAVLVQAAVSDDQRYGGDGASLQAINPTDAEVLNRDDDAAEVVIAHSGGDTAVVEGGASDTYTIALGSQPTGVVTIQFSVDAQLIVDADPDLGGDQSELTFTGGDWDQGRTISVRAADDQVAEGLHTGQVRHTVISADDEVYDELAQVDISVAITDNESVGVTVAPASGLTTTEGGGTAEFTVVLDSRPTAPVVIGLASSNTSEGTVSPASLTFSTLNWDMAQTVTITGIDDAIDDGNAAFSIVTAAAVSTDAAYNGFDPSDVGVTNQDNDGAGVVITQSGGTTEVGEAGQSDSYTVVLGSEPLDTVTITLTSSAQVSVDTDVATAGDQTTLVFTTANWSQARSVLVRAAPDDDDEADPMLVTITHAAASTDGAYNGVSIIPVQVAVRDDDEAAVVIDPTTGLVTSEGGTAASFTVVLGSRPTADVTITLTSSDTGEGTVAPGSLTFTDADWDQAQTVTVTGVDDADSDGDVAYSITALAASADAAYAGISTGSVACTNLDDESPGLVIAMSALGDNDLAVAEGGVTDVFYVSLTTNPGVGITVTVTASGNGQVTVGTPPRVFDSTNWSIPQQVSIAAIQDQVAEGAHDGTVTLTIDDGLGVSDYDALSALALGVAVSDDDTAGVTVTPNLVGADQTLVVTEAGGTATCTVRLDSDPVSDVTVTVTVSDAAQGSISTAMPLTFTAGPTGTWSTPQTVTVAGVDNGVDEGDVPFVLRFATASASTQYDDRAVADLPVINRAINNAPTIAAGNLTINEDAGAQSIALTGITAGQTGENQTLAVSLQSNSNAALTGAVTVNHVSPASTGTLTFTPVANLSGVAGLTVRVTDNGSPPGVTDHVITVTVNPVNDAPTVTVGGDLHVNRGMTALLTDALLDAADVEDAYATLTYTIYLKPPQGVLALWDGAVWNDLDTNDTFTQGDIDSGRVRYSHNNSSGSSDGFAFTVKDSGVDGAVSGARLETALRLMNIVIDDTDPPLVLIPATDLTVVEGSAAVQIAPPPSGTVGDSDSPDFAGGYLQVAIAGAVASDELTIVGTGTGAGQISVSGGNVSYEGVQIGSIRAGSTGLGGEGLAIDLTAGDDVATQALLRTIHYRNTSDAPPVGARVLSVQVSDGDGGISAVGSGSQLTRNLVITAVDDQPRMVDPVDDTPLAGDPWFATVVDLPISRQIKALDPESAAITYTLTDAGGTPAANGGATLGTVAFNAGTGAFSYTPAVGIAGQADAFYVRVSDGTSAPVVVPVRIHITGPDDADAPRFVSNAPMRSYDEVTMIYQAQQVGGTAGSLTWRLVDFPVGPTAPTLDQSGNLNWTIDAVVAPALNTYYRFGILVEDRVLHRAAYQPILIKVVASPSGNG